MLAEKISWRNAVQWFISNSILYLLVPCVIFGALASSVMGNMMGFLFLECVPVTDHALCRSYHLQFGAAGLVTVGFFIAIGVMIRYRWAERGEPWAVTGWGFAIACMVLGLMCSMIGVRVLS